MRFDGEAALTPIVCDRIRPHRLALSRDEAADVLGVSRDHFDRHVLPHVKTAAIGRRVVVSLRELDLFLEARSL